MRNLTSHTYDQQKAELVRACAPGFYEAARDLDARLRSAEDVHGPVSA